MIGKKYSKSLISRLEALEKRNPGNLVFAIQTEDGEKRVSFSELMAMKEEPGMENGVYCTGLPEFRIVGGGNLKQLDRLIFEMFGETEVIS